MCLRSPLYKQFFQHTLFLWNIIYVNFRGCISEYKFVIWTFVQKIPVDMIHIYQYCEHIQYINQGVGQ